ncbi:MAG TPA: phosphotransferase [Oligoflexia bacterium]|nr:phosphotransferase [Oligoflexia bacterium]HMR24309.1 phosphotransferase [Oligoflexia bacterium]
MKTPNKRVFFDYLPKGYFLDLDDKADLFSYLKNKKWFKAEEQVTDVEKAGEGNMNCTMRIQTTKKSYILKQARPWVEKFPEIKAPIQRNYVEKAFYDQVAQNELLAAQMPKVLHDDKDSCLLLMEDLGKGTDYADLYKGKKITDQEIEQLFYILQHLHELEVEDNTVFLNEKMRQLNHAHMFIIPFQDNNGLDLDEITPGLESVKSKVITDKLLLKNINDLGQRYLTSNTGSLLHGDFYPGSWLQTSSGIKVLDPEFCFLGEKEFDYGIMYAHLIVADQDVSLFKTISNRINMSTLLNYAGVEILRRLLGYAQLPIQLDLKQKEQLIQQAITLLNCAKD